MKEDFENNLSEAQKSEAKAKAEYDSLKAAKEDEIDTGRKLIVSIDASIAETQEKYAEEAKQLEDTQAQLANDSLGLDDRLGLDRLGHDRLGLDDRRALGGHLA